MASDDKAKTAKQAAVEVLRRAGYGTKSITDLRLRQHQQERRLTHAQSNAVRFFHLAS
jgi:hypothetical protein